MARSLGDSLKHLGHKNSSNIYVEAIEYLNSSISVVELAQRDIGNGKKGFANASDCLETWDDSNSITAVNARKIGDMLQKWWRSHSEAQYQGFEINS